jgi:phage baseplate assembly protein W
MPIGIRLPFTQTPEGGMFGSTKTSAQAIRTNLVSLLTTRRGHRVMNNRLFSPLYDYLFSQWDATTEAELDKALRDKILEFIPEVSIENILYSFEEGTNILSVKIVYRIPILGGIGDQVAISINIDDRI